MKTGTMSAEIEHLMAGAAEAARKAEDAARAASAARQALLLAQRDVNLGDLAVEKQRLDKLRALHSKTADRLAELQRNLQPEAQAFYVAEVEAIIATGKDDPKGRQRLEDQRTEARQLGMRLAAVEELLRPQKNAVKVAETLVDPELLSQAPVFCRDCAKFKDCAPSHWTLINPDRQSCEARLGPAFHDLRVDRGLRS